MIDNNSDRINENREYLIKQSEMLQGIINRMASNSLTVKQVGLTVWSAIVGFGFTNKNHALFVLAFISFILFGVLDIYYLYLERKFRDNFNQLTRIICGYEEHANHFIDQKKGNFLKPDFSSKFLQQLPDTLKSWANLPYLITLVITIVLLNIPFPTSK